MSSHLMNTYARLPIALSHGDGAWVWDTQGRRYLDALAGIAVNTLGHAHPRLVAAIADQAGKLIHTSNLYEIPLQEQLAARLCALGGMDAAFFCNSGLEANEAAIKLARLYGHHRGIARPQIVVFERAFHGRSLATLSATGNPKVQKGFEPLVEGFVRMRSTTPPRCSRWRILMPTSWRCSSRPFRAREGFSRPTPIFCRPRAPCATVMAGC